MPDVRQPGLDAHRQVVRDHLGAPAGKHVVVAADGPAVAHEAEVHGGADERAVKCKVHAAHREQRTLHATVGIDAGAQIFHVVACSVLLAVSYRPTQCVLQAAQALDSDLQRVRTLGIVCTAST